MLGLLHFVLQKYQSMKKLVLYYSLRRFPLEATKLKIPETERESCAALAPEQGKGAWGIRRKPLWRDLHQCGDMRKGWETVEMGSRPLLGQMNGKNPKYRRRKEPASWQTSAQRISLQSEQVSLSSGQPSLSLMPDASHIFLGYGSILRI